MKNENKKTLLQVEKVGLSINSKILVEGVSFEVREGEIVTLIGPNGSGKSTTAKIALGIHKNIMGNVKKFTNKIGYVPQKISIDWTLPIRVIDFMFLTKDFNNEQISDALNLTGVEHLKQKSLSNLSGGEFQRVLIARAIAKKPELLVLDEPVQGVDFKGEVAIYELIKKISEDLSCGILLISHDLHMVMSATDHVICLNGHVCCSGKPHIVAQDEKYKELFGDRASKVLTLYEHKHDHTHSQDGTINRKQ